MIQVVDVDEVLTAVERMLKDDPTLTDMNLLVEVNEKVNEDEARCPWVGVYKMAVQYPPRALGQGSGYRYQDVALILITQQSHPTAGRDCGRLLEQLNKQIVQVLFNDETLKGTVDVLDNVEVVYDQYGLTENDAYLQQSRISFVGKTAVRGG